MSSNLDTFSVSQKALIALNIYESDIVSVNRVCIPPGAIEKCSRQKFGEAIIVEQEARLVACFATQRIEKASEENSTKETWDKAKLSVMKIISFINEDNNNFLATRIALKSSDYKIDAREIAMSGEEMMSPTGIQQFVIGSMATSLKIYRLLSNGAKSKIAPLDDNNSRAPIWRLGTNRDGYIFECGLEKESVYVVDIGINSKL